MPELKDILKSGDLDGIVQSAGDLRLKSTGTVWNDIQGSLFGRRLTAANGGVSFDWDENTVVFEDNGNPASENDRVSFNVQLGHDAKADAPLRLHTHWKQENDTEIPEFRVSYRIQANGQAWTENWTDVDGLLNAANSAFPYVNGKLVQISQLCEVPLAGVGLSSLVQFQVTRIDDSGNSDMHVTFMDAHYEIDSLGSAEEYTKWTAES